MVIDASVTLACCFADEQDPFSVGVLRLLNTWDAVAPAILAPGSRQRLSHRGAGRGRLKPARTRELAAEIEALGVIVDPTHWSLASGSILNLAREHKLSAYDAAYLELALREKAPLATLDEALARVARKLKLRPLPQLPEPEGSR